MLCAHVRKCRSKCGSAVFTRITFKSTTQSSRFAEAKKALLAYSQQLKAKKIIVKRCYNGKPQECSLWRHLPVIIITAEALPGFSFPSSLWTELAVLRQWYFVHVLHSACFPLHRSYILFATVKIGH